MITICWTFPIYSHNFIYQEITELIKAGFEVCILYSAHGNPRHLGDSFVGLRGRAQQMICDKNVARQDLAYFRAKHPRRVAQAIAIITRATGLTEADLIKTDHFLYGFSFARCAEAFDADYIHSYFFYESTLFAAVAACLLAVPRGVSCYADHMLQDYPLKMVGAHLASMNVVVATSARIKEELTSFNPQAAPRIIVKTNAVDAQDWAPPLRQSIPDRPPIVVAVSRIDPKKGLEYLIEAAILLRHRGVSVRILILGAPDDNAEALAYHDRLRHRIAEEFLGDIVEMPGAQERAMVRSALFDADIFTAPAVDLVNGDKDGIPTALLEAMACRLPVVVTDAGSITEVISHNDNGFCVAQRDPEALADAIALLAQDPQLRRVFGERAQTTVQERFEVRVCETVFHTALRNALIAGPVLSAA